MRLKSILPVAAIVPLLLLTLLAGRVSADFYTYSDSSGVLHITNAPISGKYAWFMHERASVPLGPNTFSCDELIYEASARYGVDPRLVKAVVKAESDFDIHAVSRDGARGLMQLMPATASQMGVRDIHDPAENLDAGVRYLSRLLKRFDWRIPLALAAYNAGESAVRRYGGVPPYTETRRYVDKVLGYYDDYKRSGK